MVTIFLIRMLMVVLGSFIIALGSTFMIKVSHLGLHPYDVLEYALTDTFGLTFGKWHWMVGGFMICMAYLINRKLPKVGVFLEAFLVGAFIDVLLWAHWLPDYNKSMLLDCLFLITGIILVGAGTGIYIAANIGAGPTDWFSLALSERTGISYSLTTTFTEIAGTVAGFLLGGPVFIGTLLFSFFYGPIMVYSLNRCKKFVAKKTNYDPYNTVA